MAGDTKDVGDIELVDANRPHEELLASLGDTREIMARILSQLRREGWEIVRLDVGGVSNLQWPKLRVMEVVLTSISIQVVTLTIGTASYDFQALIGIQNFNFPLVITRGLNMDVTSTVGPCTLYLIGIPE